jgi:hypothetical protein
MKYSVLFLLLLAIGFFHCAKVFELDIAIHENDTVDVIDFQINDGDVSYFHSTDNNNYEIRIIDDCGKTLFGQGFEMHFYDGLFRGPNSTLPDTGPITVVSNYWKLPYYENAQAIQLFHEEKIILEYPISNFSDHKASGDSIRFPDVDQLLFGVVCISILLILAGIYLLLAKPFGNRGDGG